MQNEIAELRQRLHGRVETFGVEQFRKLDDYASLLSLALPTASAGAVAANKAAAARPAMIKPDWPHAPVHRLSNHGTYIVTAGTLHKLPIFRGEKKLDLLHDTLLKLAQQHGWHLEAWAVFANHYHFIAHATENASKRDVFLTQLHADTAREVNERDHDSGRQVWFNFWDTELTFEKSYLARLAYVHRNAVKHGLVPVANQYRWCSAAWFERTARPAQVKTIYSFKTDKLKVFDEFDVSPDEVC